MCKRFEKKGFAISVNGCLGLIRVVLCDDHDLFRHGLAEMLTIADDIEVVGEANTHERAVDIVSKAKPDVVLLDLEMPGGGPKRRCVGYSGSRSRPRSSSPCTTRRA